MSASLGQNANNERSYEFVDRETGEVKKYEVLENGRLREEFDHSQIRANRYMKLAAVREMLPKKLEVNKGKKVIEPRVHTCLRRCDSDRVQISRDRDSGRAFYSNVWVCGSVHVCPTCRAKVSERRASEIMHYVDNHQAAGGSVVMLTLTFAHTKEDNLVDILRGLKKAYRGWKELRAVKDIRKLIGEFEYGAVTATDYTHSFANGWHPHLHSLWFVRDGVNVKEVQEKLSKLWADYAEKKGLGRPDLEYGLRIDNADRVAASYVSNLEWNVGKEMTKLASKKAKEGHRNPWQLIDDYIEKDDEIAKSLFIEYAAATYGTHLMDVSPKLKAEYGGFDQSDEEVAEEKKEEADILGYLTLDQWKKVLKHSSKKFDMRAIILQIAERDFKDVSVFIDNYKRLSVVKRE